MNASLLLGMLAAPYESLAQTPECKKAVFVYLDVSGSMYLPGYDNKTKYGGDTMRLMDAMVYLLSDIFSVIEPRPLLFQRDWFRLKGFYFETKELIPSTNSFSTKDYVTLRSLHKVLDKNDDGRLNKNDFRKFLGPEYTNFISIIEDFDRSLLDVKFSGENFKTVLFLIFSDGNHDADQYDREKYSLTKLKQEIREFRERHEKLLKMGNIKFMFFELHPTNVAEIFHNTLDASISRVANIKNMSQELLRIRRILEYYLGDLLVFEGIAPEKALLNLKSKDKNLEFRFTGFNRSCVEEFLDNIQVTIESDGKALKQLMVPIPPKAVQALSRYEVAVKLKLPITEPGNYELDFVPLTRNRDAIPEHGVRARLEVLETSFSPALALLFAFFMLLFFAGIAIFIIKLRRE